jgi:hypothetical protein
MKSPKYYPLHFNKLREEGGDDISSEKFPSSRDRCEIHYLTLIKKKKYIQTCKLFRMPCICYSIRKNEDFKYKLKRMLPRLDEIIYNKRKLLESKRKILESNSNQF